MMVAKRQDPPAFQFYAKDWISSHTILGMTSEERGIYIQLLAHCWVGPDCSLPKNRRVLMHMACIENGSETALENVLKLFTIHPKLGGEFLTNPKLYSVLRAMRDKSKKRSRSATERWSKGDAKRMQKPCKTDANGYAKSMPSSSIASASSDAPSTKETKSPDGDLCKKTRKSTCPVQLIKDTWNGFVDEHPDPGFKRVNRVSKILDRQITQRWDEDPERQSLRWWNEYVRRIFAAPHLRGENDRGWRCDLIWATTPSGMERILAGRYDPGGPQRHTRAGRVAQTLVESRLDNPPEELFANAKENADES